ncbi:SufD family Fe-S cluster assembly protein [uncultured Rikenella sp.]|uniref:SufB/SufD family protein n=1 Tax=uncultured Rikenella sp. TaxID=368003 RepID=UPI00272AB196|nr:SufD family Fe-S cluster assembly protein [uncultured Rikenella sp.]
MDRILKERYKYTPLGRLAASGGAPEESFVPAQAEISTEAEAALCRVEPLPAATLREAAERSPHPGLTIDPLLLDNLGAETKQVQGVQIDIPAGCETSGILYIHLRYPSATPIQGGVQKYVQRHRIRAGRNSRVRVVVYHHACASADALIDSALLLEAEAGASVELFEVAETRATYFATVLTSIERDASVKVTTIDLDNSILRRNRFVTLAEPGADCNLEGAYLTAGNQLADNYIRMHHASAHCRSNQLFKGVAEDDSRGAFTGHIYVAPDAQQTVALQENHNIVLSDRARIDTRPQLEIYADDVKCNHGATVGRLDPEAVYYMRQRGIALEAAKRLQIEGFIREVIDHTRLDDLERLLHDKVAKRLLHI